MSKGIFPIFRRRAPLLELFKGQEALTLEALTPEQRALAEEFRRGIASALGVPPEAIREDILVKWVKEWSRAFIKPEYYAQLSPKIKQAIGLI